MNSHESDFGVTIGARCEFVGVTESEEAWRRADVIRREVANVLAAYGVVDGDPLVNVWHGRREFEAE